MKDNWNSKDKKRGLEEGEGKLIQALVGNARYTGIMPSIPLLCFLILDNIEVQQGGEKMKYK